MSAPIETLEQQPPEAIEREIAATRASLDRKLEELENRLSPRAHLERWQETLDPRQHLDIVAVGLVVAGGLMALAGWRRAREVPPEDVLVLDDMVHELVICE